MPNKKDCSSFFLLFLSAFLLSFFLSLFFSFFLSKCRTLYLKYTPFFYRVKVSVYWSFCVNCCPGQMGVTWAALGKVDAGWWLNRGKSRGRHGARKWPAAGGMTLRAGAGVVARCNLLGDVTVPQGAWPKVLHAGMKESSNLGLLFTRASRKAFGVGHSAWANRKTGPV